MNPAELERKLMAAARANPPAERVPYAFAKRVMAGLPKPPAPDGLAFWAGALLRAAAACLSIALFLAALFLLHPPGGGARDDLAQDFENTMLAAVAQDAEVSW